jgi:hypothetical protein
MARAGASLRTTAGGGRAEGRFCRARWPVAAAGLAVALLLACATPHRPGAERAARASVAVGLELYGSGELVLSARRFALAAQQARAAGDRELVRDTLTAQCLAWLRARRLDELARCAEELEAEQRRAPRSDAGVNTLLAFGAIAGGRPLPPLRLPSEVRGVVRAAAGEEG